MGKLFMEIHRADVGLLSTSSNSSDLFLPYSPSGLFKFGSVTDLKKSKSEWDSSFDVTVKLNIGMNV